MVLGAAMLQRPVSSSTRRRPCNPFGTGHGKRVRPSSGQQPLSNTAGQLPAPDCPGKGGECRYRSNLPMRARGARHVTGVPFQTSGRHRCAAYVLGGPAEVSGVEWSGAGRRLPALGRFTGPAVCCPEAFPRGPAVEGPLQWRGGRWEAGGRLRGL